MFRNFPTNLAAVVGTPVQMPCAVIAGTNSVSWSETSAGSLRRITNNQNVDTEREDGHRYEVSGDHAAQEYTLGVKSVLSNDSGAYQCSDDSRSFSAWVHLIVLGKKTSLNNITR